MPVTPSGIISEPTDALADLVAGTSTWQTACGVGSAVLAKEFIDPVAWGAPALALTRPKAIISLPRNATFSRGAYGAGTLWLMIECDVDEDDADDHADASYAFSNFLGALIEEMMDDAEASGALIVRSIVIDVPPQRNKRAEKKGKDKDAAVDYFQVSLLVNYGIPENG